MYVRPPARHRHLEVRAGAGHEEAEMAEHALDLRQAEIKAREPLRLAKREIDDAIGKRHLARDRDFRWRAAAKVDHHPGRQLEAGDHEGRVDAALEAIARVRIDAELAAGLRDVGLVPQ